MAGSRPADDRRRSHEYDRDYRDRDYRDHDRHRHREGDRDLFSRRPNSRDDAGPTPMRERDHRANNGRETPHRPPDDRSGSNHGKKASSVHDALHSGPLASATSKSDTSGPQWLPTTDINLLVDTLSKRAYWYSLHDSSAKKQMKLQGDLDRAGSNYLEFASAKDVTDGQLKRYKKEKETYFKRMDDMDQAAGSLIQAMSERFLTAVTQEISRASPGAKPTSNSASEKSALDTFQGLLVSEIRKLKEEVDGLRKNDTEKFERLLSQESAKRKSMETKLAKQDPSVTDKLETEIRGLKHRFDQESAKNKMLEDKLNKMEQNFNDEYKTETQELKRLLDQENSRNRSLAEKVMKLELRVTDKFENEIRELKQHLSGEGDKNRSLENKLEEMEKKLEASRAKPHEIEEMDHRLTASSEKDHNAICKLQHTATEHARQISGLSGGLSPISRDVASLSRQLDNLTKKQDEKFANLNSLISLTASQTPADYAQVPRMIEETNVKIEALEMTVDSLKTSLDETEDISVKARILALELGRLKSAVESHEAWARKEIMSIKSSMASLLVLGEPRAASILPESRGNTESTTSPPPASDAKITSIINAKIKQANAPMQTALNGRFRDLAEKFGTYIDSQNKRQDEANTVFSKNLGELQREVAELKDANFKALRDVNDRLCLHVEQQGGKISSLDGGLKALRDESLGGLESLQLQIGHFNQWKNNFTTKQLYQDIANELLGKMSIQIKRVSERIDTLEAGDSGLAAKKRKVTNGNAVVVNGNH